MEKLIKVTKRAISREKMNTDNLEKLLMNLKEIISKNHPDFICRTNEIRGRSLVPDNAYTFCWSGDNIPNEFLNTELETFGYICFGFEGKSVIEEIPRIYNLGCSSLIIDKIDDDKVNNSGGLYCLINFNLLPSEFINKNGSDELMNTKYDAFEIEFYQLIKPFLKSGIDVSLPEVNSLSFDDYLSIFKSILLDKDNKNILTQTGLFDNK